MSHIELQMINCGGNCKRCAAGARPHGPYGFLVTGSRTKNGGDKRKFKYLGLAKGKGKGTRLDITDVDADAPREELYSGESRDNFRWKIEGIFAGGRKPREGTFREALVEGLVQTEIAERESSLTVASFDTMGFLAKASRDYAREEVERLLEKHSLRDESELMDRRPDDAAKIVSEAERRYAHARSEAKRLKDESVAKYESTAAFLEEQGKGDLPGQIMQRRLELKKITREIKQEVDGRSTEREKAATKEYLNAENKSRRDELKEQILSIEADIKETVEAF